MSNQLWHVSRINYLQRKLLLIKRHDDVLSERSIGQMLIIDLKSVKICFYLQQIILKSFCKKNMQKNDTSG